MADNMLKISTKFISLLQNSGIKAQVYYNGDEDNAEFLDNGNTDIENACCEKLMNSDNGTLFIDFVAGTQALNILDFGEEYSKGKPYIKLYSGVNFAYDVSATQHGFAISAAAPESDITDPVLVPYLPKSLDVLPIRVLLLPLEVAIFAVKAPFYLLFSLAKLVIKVLRGTDNDPETTNVEVGDDGEGKGL